MTDVILDHMYWQITDDAFDNFVWTGLSKGEIWLDEKTAWGFYFAKWIPNQKDDLKLMLLAVNQQLEVDLVIGFSCAVGDLESLRQDAPEDVPWQDWHGQTPIRLDEFKNYTKAQDAMIIAKQLIQQDASLAKYVGLIDISLVDHSSSIDEFGYYKVAI